MAVAVSAQDSLRLNVYLFAPGAASVPQYRVTMVDDASPGTQSAAQDYYSNGSGLLEVDMLPSHSSGYVYLKSVDCQGVTTYSDSIYYTSSSGKDTLNSSILISCVDTCIGSYQKSQVNGRTWTFTRANPGEWAPNSSQWSFGTTSGPMGAASGHSVTRTFNYSPVFVTLQNQGCVLYEDTLYPNLPPQRDSLNIQFQLTENLVPLEDYQIIVHHDSAIGYTDTTILYSGANGAISWGNIPPFYSGDMYVESIDCLGNSHYSDTISFDLNTGVATLTTSIDLPCADECMGTYSVTQTGGNTFRFVYDNSGRWRRNICNWTFTGSPSSNRNSVYVTPTVSPMYVTLTHKGCVIKEDTINSSGVVVALGEASFIVDTVNSFGGQVVIWNTSIDTSGSRADSTTFHWDFGDGNTSNQAFPTHQFAGSGPYWVWLTQTWYLNGTVVYQDTHRDSLGMDSTGQLIYKNGFMLRVLDPNGFSLEELTPDLVRVYPQPANEWIQVEADREIKSIVLVDLNGRMLKKWTPNDASVRLDVSSEIAGYYFIRVETESGIVVKKCILRLN